MVNRPHILLFDKMNAVELNYMFSRNVKESAKIIKAEKCNKQPTLGELSEYGS